MESGFPDLKSASGYILGNQIMKKAINEIRLIYRPLSIDYWNDFEKLFGEKGACGGCWCMWWRLKRSQFEKQKGEKNRKAMYNIVKSGEIPGILTYTGNKPIGWCSVAPREKFPSLERSRILARVDHKPVWSVVCFYIHKSYRDKGISLQLLTAATEYVKKEGGTIIEGYPITPKEEKMPKVFAWTGFYNTFVKAGFQEVIRRSDTRPIMRLQVR
jgi:GNAT superfamily N-acetyltransferase